MDMTAALTSPIRRSRAVPISEYGFLSDGEVSALVAPGGSVDWMCLPRFDAPSAFGAILGRHAGTFRIAPLDATVPAARRYLPGTMILETSWGTATGWMIVRDALLVGPWHHEDDRSLTYKRTPNDYEAEHIFLRTIRCVSGEVQTIMDCEPVLDYVDWAEFTRRVGDGHAEATREHTFRGITASRRPHTATYSDAPGRRASVRQDAKPARSTKRSASNEVSTRRVSSRCQRASR